jgi:ribulose-phosphate 3-epimerase
MGGEKIKISASMYAADQGRLAEEAKRAEEGGADGLHFDVMDGHFIPNIGYGPEVVRQLRSEVGLPFGVHLMVENPEKFIDHYVKAGSETIYVHVESCPFLQRVLGLIRHKKAKAGIALNPSTPASTVKHVLDQADAILLLTNNDSTFLGDYQSQQFIPAMIPKIEETKRLVHESSTELEVAVDGGITTENARDVVRAGARIIISGSAIFGKSKPAEGIHALRAAAELGL